MGPKEQKSDKLVTRERKAMTIARKYLKRQVPFLDLQLAWAEMEVQKEKGRK